MTDDTDPADAQDDGPDALRQTVDATDTTTRRTRERKADRIRREAIEFWQSVFANPIGRREMWAILEQGKTFEDIFACGPNGFPQPEATWFHAGAKSLGQRIYHGWTAMDRPGVFRMLDEHDPRFAIPGRPKKRDD